MAILAAVLAPIGCGESVTAPEFPDVLGEFSGFWTYQISVPATGNLTLILCSGAFQITEQSDQEFSGRYSQDEVGNCTGVTGSVTGQVQSDGAVHLAIKSDSGRDFETSTGCTLTQRDDGYRGSVVADTLTIAHFLAADCPTEDGSGTLGVEWYVEFSGAREVAPPTSLRREPGALDDARRIPGLEIPMISPVPDPVRASTRRWRAHSSGD